MRGSGEREVTGEQWLESVLLSVQVWRVLSWLSSSIHRQVEWSEQSRPLAAAVLRSRRSLRVSPCRSVTSGPIDPARQCHRVQGHHSGSAGTLALQERVDAFSIARARARAAMKPDAVTNGQCSMLSARRRLRVSVCLLARVAHSGSTTVVLLLCECPTLRRCCGCVLS